MDRDVQANSVESRSTPFDFLRGDQSLSLQTLAATKEALVLWRNMYYNPDHNGHPVWIAFPKGLPESRREIISVPLPPPIKSIIDDRISTIGEEIKMWEVNFRAAVIGQEVLNMWDEIFAKIHRKFSFGRRSSRCADLSQYNVSNEDHVDVLVKGFDNIVCNRDGTICFRGSVRNLLAKEELDPAIRFRISCVFCLEDEVMRIWPLVNHNLPDEHLFGDISEQMRYWKRNLNIVENNQYPISYEILLTSLEINRNWAAIEYFWDKVDEGIQTRFSMNLLQFKNDFYLMKRVLLKLKENQLQNICPRTGDRIFSNIVTHPKYYEYAIDSWACMKNYSLSGSLFAKIVDQLWQLVFNPSESELTRVNHNSFTLLEVWTSAADSLKSNVSQTDLFAKLDQTVRGVHHYDIKFMFELLANTSDSSKKEIWLENWRKLMIRAKPSDLDQLMKLCLANDDEIEQFKETTATNIDELNDYFDDCLKKGLYSELGDCLKFFVKNPRRLEELSREMIMSNLDRISSCDEVELSQYHLFIRNTFRDAEKADKFNKEFISSPECLGWIYSKLDDCCFDKVVNLSRKFPCNKKNLREMKDEFLVYCRRNFARGQISGFHEQRFVEFVSWCGVGEETVSKFKKSLNIDDIFEIILNDFVQKASMLKELKRGFNEQLLSGFDNFLRWYFGSSKAAKSYKFIKLINYHEWEGVRNALQKRVRKRVREDFLNWGFENDENEVDKVMSRLRMESG